MSPLGREADVETVKISETGPLEGKPGTSHAHPLVSSQHHPQLSGARRRSRRRARCRGGIRAGTRGWRGFGTGVRRVLRRVWTWTRSPRWARRGEGNVSGRDTGSSHGYCGASSMLGEPCSPVVCAGFRRWLLATLEGRRCTILPILLASALACHSVGNDGGGGTWDRGPGMAPVIYSLLGVIRRLVVV